jgi:hypothetical protein
VAPAAKSPQPIPHPIGGRALEALTLVDGAPPALTQEAAAGLVDALAAYKAKPELKDAVAELLYVAAFLELEQKATAAADAILEVARASIPWLRAMGIAIDDVLEGTAAGARMDALTGRSDSKVPVGQRGAAPAGSAKWWQVRK